ncbi:hypothetical protein Taro_049066 [Colocasia esculenta]|uniref:EamA domain-containing protein n=1 Tax=Colocasia esculenta TaxID=4460 RepID=A0A843X9X8_COLES|nr:hypothetical protein [Colocasia esculenta]
MERLRLGSGEQAEQERGKRREGRGNRAACSSPNPLSRSHSHPPPHARAVEDLIEFCMAVDICGTVDRLKPAAGMVLVQMVFAGVNIFYKLAANDRMDLRVLVAYRHIFGMAFLIPLAFLLERKDRPRLTPTILIQSFFCGLFGGTVSQNLYAVAIKLTTATFTTAITNLIPVITFILAVIFRLERLQMRTMSGQAKVGGTVLGLGGAMLLTFYRGPDINIWTSKIDLLQGHDKVPGMAANKEPGNRVVGSLMAVASCFCYSIWLIIQAKMSRSYTGIYSSSALMCAMGALQSTAYGLFMQRDWREWRLRFDIRLITVVYAGIFASGVTLMVMAWCIALKGPLYISVFNPLMLVMVAVLSSLLLDEKLHLGILGGLLIVGGLYLVLWGKGREAAKVAKLPVTSEVANSAASSLPNRSLDGELLVGKPAAEVQCHAGGAVGRAPGAGFHDGVAKALHDRDGGKLDP